MSTQKDRIEKLENDVQDINESIQWMAQGSEVRMQQMEQTLKETMDRVVKDMHASAKSVGEHPLHGGKDKDVGSLFNTGGYRDYRDDGQHKRHLKMDFPRFSGDDPTEWLNQANQFFAYQQTSEEQKVSLAAFYLEGAANQWWQWLSNIYQVDATPITWELFIPELLACFGPTTYEDFDEALFRIT
jgi:hypothetical protein